MSAQRGEACGCGRPLDECPGCGEARCFSCDPAGSDNRCDDPRGDHA